MRSKLALISLLLGIFSFINLLGIEKAVLAIIIGIWALKENMQTTKYTRLSRIGIMLGVIYLVTIAVIIVFYFPKMILLLGKLK